MADEFASALTELDACCAAYPKEPESLFRRGVVLLMHGKKITRVRHYSRHTAFIPDGASSPCALQTQGYQ
jgi:hypothetical protein